MRSVPGVASESFQECAHWGMRPRCTHRRQPKTNYRKLRRRGYTFSCLWRWLTHEQQRRFRQPPQSFRQKSELRFHTDTYNLLVTTHSHTIHDARYCRQVVSSLDRLVYTPQDRRNCQTCRGRMSHIGPRLMKLTDRILVEDYRLVTALCFLIRESRFVRCIGAFR
jgi:hypothetical protein